MPFRASCILVQLKIFHFCGNRFGFIGRIGNYKCYAFTTQKLKFTRQNLLTALNLE